MFPTFEMFIHVLDKLTTSPFDCMVINNTVHSNRLEDQIMWYKVNYEPPWRLMVDKKRKWLDVVREELMQKTWHPNRIKQCLDHDEFVELFGSRPYILQST